MPCWKNITSYLKNHWTKHGCFCTHFDAFFMLLPNLGIIFDNNSKLFEIFLTKMKVSSLVSHMVMEKVKTSDVGLSSTAE